MKYFLLLNLFLQTTFVVAGSASADPCAELQVAKNINVKLIHKEIETVQGVTAQMGTFELTNLGETPIVLSGYMEKNRFSMWHPDAWLQGKLLDGRWHDLFDSFSDTLPAPNSLIVGTGVHKQFITTIHTGDTSVSQDTPLRLVIRPLKPNVCAYSEPFTGS
jgi:hypothetical protein